MSEEKFVPKNQREFLAYFNKKCKIPMNPVLFRRDDNDIIEAGRLYAAIIMVFSESYHAVSKLSVAFVHENAIDIQSGHPAVLDVYLEMERLAHLRRYQRGEAEVTQECHSTSAQPLMGTQAWVSFLFQIDLPHIIVIAVLGSKAHASRELLHSHLHLYAIIPACTCILGHVLADISLQGLLLYKEEAVRGAYGGIQQSPASLMP